MDDKELNLQAEETLAITNPEAYSTSNPSPREWTMTAQEIARSVKINPIEALTTKAQREGPEKYNWLETVGKGIADAMITGVQDIDEAINVRNMEFSSPDMTTDEAERLMQDALYTRHFLRQTRQADTAEKIKYKKWYDFSNAVGSAIKYAGLGIITGSPAAIGAVAGIESAAQMEADLVDRYIEKTGDIEGYTKDERIKDLGIAGAYGVFNGITESMLGVERLATGALGRYSTLEAMARLARAQGKIGKSIAIKALRRAGMSAIEEGGEEFIQSIGEDLANAIAGYGEDLGSIEGFKKALTSAIYGAIIGGTMGWGLYRYNRKSIVDKINKWNTERGAGLDEAQMAEVADQIIEDGKTQMLDEIATRVEIKNQYGQAYDTIKERIGELIDATGTTPWTDQNKSKEEYIEAAARTITLPAIIASNQYGIPLSEFIDVANLEVLNAGDGKTPVLMFAPIRNIEDAKALREQQKLIIKEQTDAKKLGAEKEGLKEAAQRRVAILNTLIRDMEREQGIQNARRTSRKAQADYITAKDLKPESTGRIETATQAEEGQDYVLFAGQRIPVEYQVVELAQIQPSHIDGEPNPNYTNVELQNRASRGTVQDVADLREKATNITPERLLRAPTSAEGAPVVNELGEVIAGNRRAEIIRYAYENPETAEKYRKAIEQAGFDTTGLAQPVLVRRNTTMTPEEQVAAAELSNISETSAFDEASQAKRDTQYLKDSESPTEFAAKIPMSERRGLMQNNGKWNNRQVKQRYEDALLSWLTGNDTQLFESLVLDGNISQKVLDTLVANGALIHTVASQYPDTNLREDIYHALLKMQIASKDNFIELTQQIELDGRDVMPENILVWNWLFADATTNRQFLSNYATILRQNHESMDNGQDMFGDKVAPLSRKDALMQALKKTDEARAQMAADRGREYESLFAEETGEVKNPELAAAIASYQNQFAPQAQLEQTILNKQQFDLADQNARLDEIYPEYTAETIEVDGKERTVYNSEGKRINKSAEALTNFWRWFGDSKVVDEQGRPIVLYHGTKSDTAFEEFADNATWATPEQDYAQLYNTGLGVYTLYYKSENPAYLGDINNEASNANLIALAESVNATREELDNVINSIFGLEIDEFTPIYDITNTKEFENLAKSKGFDGFQAIEHGDNGDVDTYAVFASTQIKSVENRGTYSPETANIYNKIAYTSGATYFERPSTKYVLRGGEGQIVHGWGVYSMEDREINKRRYRDVFAGKPVYVLNEETKEAVSLTGLGMFATNVLDRANRIIGETFGTNMIDEVVTTNPKTFGGFIGFVSLSSYSTFEDISGFASEVAKGFTTFDNIDQNADYASIKERAKRDIRLAKIIKSIVESGHKKYNTQKMKKAFPDSATRTWASISEAVRNLTKAQKELFLNHLDITEEMPTKDAELFIKALQYPENIKRTRGQQLAIEVPNAEDMLNEDMVLADQASAPKIRAILEDWLPGGLLFDFVEKADENDFELFREIHNIKAQDLHEFYETVFEEAQETMFGNNPKMPESAKLLVDYLMNNMKGDDFYVAMMETIPETYIELKSGEVIGEEKDYESIPEQRKSIMGMEDIPPELARDTSLFLNEQGIKGIQYRGGTDRTGYVTFSDDAIKVLKRLDDELPIYYKKGARLQGQYDSELQTILLTKYWDETTLVHEFHHRYLEKIWGKFKQAQAGTFQANAAFVEDTRKLFDMLGIDPNQDELTVVQQERFATMVEAYVTGLGVDDQDNLAFQGFLHWVPEKYRSIMDLGYLDEQGRIQNPMLDQESIDFFNRWFASPLVPSLPSAPDAQRMVNPTDDKDEIIPSSQKVMNDREKEWGQDSEIQNKADAQLWKAIGENNPSDLRAAIDGQEEINKLETNNLPDDRLLPEPHKPTLREKWFKARQPDARELAAEKAREYVEKNPEHARELAFADPETLAEFDAPVDQGMLIRAVMETVGKGSDEWYILDNNLAMVKSMSGSTLALSGDMSHQAYLDAKREVEAARELKAAVNYAGTRFGALDKWNNDIRAFAAKRTAAIMATAPGSKEREVAIKAFLEEAKTKFSGNTTNAVLNKLDLTGYQTKNSQAFIKWAEKQIKNVAHAQLDTKEQAELMKESAKAQLALRDIDSREMKDGQYVRAVAAAKAIRHWQFVKDKMKKAYIGRWGLFGIWFDNLVSSYVPSAMLMSFNTLFFANVPSTAINNTIVKRAARMIGENKVDSRVTKGEIQRIKQIFNASGMNLAQMEKPTSPSLMHGEKYTNQDQKHWYNFTFDVLSKEDNWFRIPTFVDALARIATRDAKGDINKATMLFKQYAQLNDPTDEAKIARKEALAVANMAVFTQDGMMASALNHIRSNLNTLTRTPLGLDPNGFGLGNILAPFLKTGANVIEMGITATLAPVRTAIKAGKIYRTITKSKTGTKLSNMEKITLSTDWAYLCLAAVATALLAAFSGDDDDWYEEPYELGKRYDPNKPYDSIRLGNTWVKLDLFGPLEVPLRTAAMLVKNWEDKKLAAVGNGLYEALGEVPLVNQFVDSNTDYMTKYPGKWASSFAYTQLNKFVPAQAKTVIRAGSRATGTKADVSWAGPTIEKKFHRNYGLDGAQLTTNDLLNILSNRIKYVEKK